MNLKRELIDRLTTAAQGVAGPDVLLPEVQLERTRDPAHGQYASNLAMLLGRTLRRPPRAIAEAIAACIDLRPPVLRVEVAGPGFINFHIDPAAALAVVPRVLAAGADYGRVDVGRGRRIQVEFVSANPTGPLHIGHGRGAAYGAALAGLLAAAGFEVSREYYVNDAGRQMHILALSVWLRYLEAGGATAVFPANAYQGAYVHEIAASLRARSGARFERPLGAAFAVTDPEDPETHIDALIESARVLLGAEDWREVHAFGTNAILSDIRDDLAGFGVHFDHWFSEQTLMDSGAVEAAVARLAAAGLTEQREGATWFLSTRFGDEKDRVLVRENGQPTYFASDVAYHLGKFERGFDRVIDIWGADHHGYVARVRAALQGLGVDPSRLEVLLVQFATLHRGGERVQMSTRSGSFVTLRELREDVGRDAARFFYVTRRSEQHLDFDLDLARSQSNENPVYYLQYAHARIASVFRQAAEQGIAQPPATDEATLALLVAEEEQALLERLARHPEVIEAAALAREPHQVCNHLRDLATHFHAWYNNHKFLQVEPPLRAARLALAAAVRQVLANGLALLGVSAPESM